MAADRFLGIFLKKVDKLGHIILMTAVYLVLAVIALRLATLNASASPFWPASGFALAILLSRRPAASWAILLGAFLANMTTSNPWTAALGIAVGNLSEGLVARSIYERMMRRADATAILQRTFALTLAAIVGAFCSASLGHLILDIHSGLEGFKSWKSFLTWWGGDITGIMVLTPILYPSVGFQRPNGKSSAALGLILISIGMTLYFSFEKGQGGRVFMIFLPMLLSALWLDAIWIGRIAAITAVGAISCAAIGNGPFFGLQLNDNLLGFQLLINSLMLSALCAENFLVHARKALILTLLASGWLLSGWLFYTFHQRHAEQDRLRVHDLVLKTEQRINSSMESYASILYDVAGLIATDPAITLQRWQEFIDASQIIKRFPEITGIGFVTPLKVIDKEAFETKRKDLDGSKLAIQSDCEAQKRAGDSFFIVQFISPLANNLRVLGYDVSCETNRFKTLERARVNRQPSLTPPIELVQQNHRRPGLLLYVPVYAKDRFLGWISGVFVVETVMHNLLGPYENELHFTLSPGTQNGIARAIYQTRAAAPATDLLRPLHLGGQDFQLAVGRSSGFQVSKDLAFAWVGAFGVLLTLALGHLVTSNQLIHQRAKEEVRQQMETIASRDRLWQTLTEFAPVGIFQINAQGEPTFSNRFWQNLTGGSHATSTTEERWNRVHPEDRKRLVPLWQNLLKSGSVMREEMRLIKPEGLTWAKVHTAPIIGNQGQIEGFVGVALDITERKLREAEIERERIKAIHTAKMASLGEMASGIAHEINNPLAVINAIACHLSMRKTDVAEDLRADIKRLEEMTERIAKIIRGLRAFSRNSDKDPIQPQDLHAIVTDTLVLCQARFEASDVFLKVVDIPHLRVGCRGGQLSQIILNLLSNAHDAALLSKERWVRLDVEIRGGQVLIKVTDSGPGIPPHLVSRIMEPFFTTKDVDKGTGLGLSIAKGIAEDHGGHLWFDSTAAHTCFILELQLMEAATA